jgi:Pyridine nucleotide-disulphide oxidoreductase, dimerisation domain
MKRWWEVNERLETTAPGIWAIGEVAGSPQFTHISADDSRVFRDNVAGGNHVTTGRQVPFCLFTGPEFARVGMGEKEARAKGVDYRLFKIPMAGVLRARTLGETRGFLKASGLGLRVVNQIVKKHQGTTRVRSRNDPEGSTGTVLSLFLSAECRMSGDVGPSADAKSKRSVAA